MEKGQKPACSNPSGVANKPSSNNNLFTFISNFNRCYDLLDETKTVKCMNEKGEIYEKELTDEEVISIKSVADEFMSEFKEYLLNGSYGQSEKEAQLIKMKLNNCNSEEIMKHLNYTNQSSVRSSIARLTNKVYRHVFNKETILKGLDELSSVETLRKGIMCIRTARFKFDMSDAFPLEFREQIRGRGERTRVRANSFDKNEVLKVIRFLATYSSDVFTANLNDLDKNALTYVLRALNQPKDAPNTQPNYMYHLLISNPAWLLDYSEEKLEGLMKDGASDFNSVRKNMKD
jgi:hypothetical protein